MNSRSGHAGLVEMLTQNKPDKQWKCLCHQKAGKFVKVKRLNKHGRKRQNSLV